MNKIAFIILLLLSNLGFALGNFYELEGKEESYIKASNKVSNGFYTTLPYAEFTKGIAFESYTYKDSINKTQNFFNFSRQLDFGSDVSLEFSYLLDTNRVLYGDKLSIADLSGLNLSLDYTFGSNCSDFRRYVGIDAALSPAIHMGGEYYFNNNSYIKADLAVQALIYPTLSPKKAVPVASLSYGVKF